jgi:hypothetical protein
VWGIFGGVVSDVQFTANARDGVGDYWRCFQ